LTVLPFVKTASVQTGSFCVNVQLSDSPSLFGIIKLFIINILEKIEQTDQRSKMMNRLLK
jgi:hypothetical protein